MLVYLRRDDVDVYVDWVLHACGSGTGSGGPWERVFECMQLDELMMKARGVHTYL